MKLDLKAKPFYLTDEDIKIIQDRLFDPKEMYG